MVEVLHILRRDWFVIVTILLFFVNKKMREKKWMTGQFRTESTSNVHFHYASWIKHYLLEAIVLLTVRTVPAVPVSIRNLCVLITEPTIYLHVRWFLPTKKKKTFEKINVFTHNVIKNFMVIQHYRKRVLYKLWNSKPFFCMVHYRHGSESIQIFLLFIFYLYDSI